MNNVTTPAHPGSIFYCRIRIPNAKGSCLHGFLRLVQEYQWMQVRDSNENADSPNDETQLPDANLTDSIEMQKRKHPDEKSPETRNDSCPPMAAN
jgi:hypothetical protein